MDLLDHCDNVGARGLPTGTESAGRGDLDAEVSLGLSKNAALSG